MKIICYVLNFTYTRFICSCAESHGKDGSDTILSVDMLRAPLRDILMVRVKTQNNGSLTVTFLCFVLLVETYLNGKLDDDTKYAVFQRSFHTVDDYENEGFIIFTTNKDNTAAVVAGVVVSLIVVAVIVVVVVLYIRRRNRDKASDGEDVPMNSKPARTKSVSAFFRRSGIGELLFRKVFSGSEIFHI